MSWPVDSAFEEVEPARTARVDAPVMVSASDTRTGRLSLTVSLSPDARKELGAQVGDRFKVYSTQTRSGIYLRLVRSDTGHAQLSQPPNAAHQSAPRALFRIGGLDLPVRRGKKQVPDWRVIEVARAPALEMRLAAMPELPGEAAADQVARRMKAGGSTAAEIRDHLKSEQNFNATAEWLASRGIE